eukprot:SAG11_NODE_11640_length_747_cov_1.177469_2_plen_92_part_00
MPTRTVCQKFKTGNHAPFASPRCTIAAPVPFASISGDVFDMPPTVDDYDSILLVICNWSKYCVLIPMKSKGWGAAEPRVGYQPASSKYHLK